MKRVILTCSMILALSATVFGQEAASTPPANPIDVVIQFLSFSEPQAAQFSRSVAELQSTASGIQSQLESKQRNLSSLLNTPKVDEAAVGKLVVEIYGLQNEMQLAFQRYHSTFVSLLTPEQNERVTKVVQAREMLPMVAVFAALNLVEPPASPRPDAR